MDSSPDDQERPGDFVPMSEADLLVFDALWSGVVNDWPSDDRHLKLIEHARSAGALLEAAKRYGALKDDAERGEMARKRLSTIALLATQELLATKSDPKPRTPVWVVAVGVAVCLTLLGVAFYFAWGFSKP
ncbi:MAG: hypothetical protein ABI175_28475 [Polyangiales bacterium]